jgi:hypothetical protein
MPKKSTVGKMIRVSAGEGNAGTAQDLADLRGSMRRPVCPDDIPELKGTEVPVCRDASGKLPKRKFGPVRQAILQSLDEHEMTRYELWKKARTHCVTLSRSAVYEYLRGSRDIGVEYAEALMEAVELKVVAEGRRRPGSARE